MKRLSQERKLYLERRRRKNLRRQAVCKRYKASSAKPKYLGGNVIRAPDAISLESDIHRHELLSFLEKLRSSVVKDGKPTVINLLNTERMVAAGSLLFMAELYRVCELAKSKAMVRCIPPRDVKVNQVLKQIGVFELLGYTKKLIRVSRMWCIGAMPVGTKLRVKSMKIFLVVMTARSPNPCLAVCFVG